MYMYFGIISIVTGGGILVRWTVKIDVFFSELVTKVYQTLFSGFVRRDLSLLTHSFGKLNIGKICAHLIMVKSI
jgi:hypothetical protein